MGRLNELLGAAAGYSRGLSGQFNLDEQEGVPTLAPELVPTSDIHQRPEQWALHSGTLLVGTILVAAGGVGFNSQTAIEPGAGELVIVETIELFLDGTTAGYRLALSSVPLSTSTGNLVARDARRIVTVGGSGASGTRIMTKNDAATSGVATTIWRFPTPVGEVMHTLTLDLVLVTPWSLRLINDTTNTSLKTTNWRVRARPATPRELAIGAI